MKLYAHPRSDPCRYIMNMCKHLGVEVDSVLVDLVKDEQKGEAYLSINPNGKVPMLQVGDFKLTETFTIAKYLVDLFG